MSALGRIGGDVRRKVRLDSVVHPSIGVLAVAVAFVGFIILAVLALAAVYSVSSTQVASTVVASTLTTSTTTTSTTVVATSSTSVPTSSTETTLVEATTSTTESTTTTISKEQIAFCMSSRTDDLYLRDMGAVSPSKNLESYLGDYSRIFPITDCSADENKEACNNALTAFVEADNLILGEKPSNTIGYPALVKGGTAYIIRSPKEFERVLGCGSLSGG
ncbi:MAG: hypothetical protein V1744_02310 [Candidatus Altiarchaeota archaeon]